MVTLLELQTLLESDFYTNSMVAGVIIICGFILGKLISKIVGILIKRYYVPMWQPEVVLEQIIRYTIYAVSIIAALNRLGLAKTVLHIILLVIFALVTITVVLTSKDFLLNLSAGMQLLPKLHLKKKEKLSINKIEGTIKSFSLVETDIVKANGDIVVFPNAYFRMYDVEKL